MAIDTPALLVHVASQLVSCEKKLTANVCNAIETESFNTGYRTGKTFVDHSFVDAERFKNLGALVALQRADAHLGHDFQYAFGDALAIRSNDLVVVVKAEDVLPTKRLGSVVAVAMIERASHAKARLAACHDCARCVDELGLSGIGKKGVLVAAAALSQETLSENRAACLELMELVLVRMNGDIQRLARICGSSLSGKARRLLEERWQKRKANGGPPRPSEDSASRRTTRIPTPKKGSPPASMKAARTTSPKPSLLGSRSTDPGANTILHDELPALVLRPKGTETPPKESSRSTTNSTLGSSNNFLSGFSAGNESLGLHFSTSSMLADHATKADTSSRLSFPSASNRFAQAENNAAPSSHVDRESFGAAASLRARLLKIREKSKHPEIALAAALSSVSNNVSFSDTGAPRSTGSIYSSQVEKQIVDSGEKSPEYVSGMACIVGLLSKATPLHEADKDLDEGIEAMKKFHAALSKQQNVVVGISTEELSMLRQSIAANVDDMIERFSQ